MQTNDEILWSIARKRADFKKQLTSYILVCGFLWAIWFLSGRNTDGYNHYPWPIWISFWWGVGLVYSYLNAYTANNKQSIEEEYQKLKNQQ